MDAYLNGSAASGTFDFTAMNEALDSTVGSSTDVPIQLIDNAAEPEALVSSAGSSTDVPNVIAPGPGAPEECEICFDRGQKSFFACGHRSCIPCYMEIMRSNAPRCPMCRKDLLPQATPTRRMEYTASPMVGLDGLFDLLQNYPAAEEPERQLSEYVFINIQHLGGYINGVNANFQVVGLTDNLQPSSTVKAFKCVLARRLGMSYGIFIRDYNVILISTGHILDNNRLHLDNHSLQLQGLRIYDENEHACSVSIQRKVREN